MIVVFIAAEAAGIVLVLTALAAGLPPAIAAAAGLATAAALAVPVRGRTAIGAARVRSRHVLDRRGYRAARPPHPARDAQECAAPGRNPAPHAPSAGPHDPASPSAAATLSLPPATGFRWDGAELVCALQVRPARGTVCALAPGGRADTHTATLPLPALADMLEQFDIRLSGIDAHVRGTRAAGPDVLVRAVRRLTGPLAAMARRDAVLLVRLDPDGCPAAVARRGGGERGTLRAAGVAAARIMRALESYGQVCTMLTAADLDAAVRRFAGTDDGRDLRTAWDHVTVVGAGPGSPTPGAKAPGGAAEDTRADRHAPAPRIHTVHRLDIGDGRSAGFEQVWLPECDSAVLSVRLRPSAVPGYVRVGALVRYVADRRIIAPAGADARALHGGQADGLWATTPRGDRRFDRAAGCRDVPTGLLERIVVPVGPHGQLLGGDRSGNAVLGTLVGPAVRTVEIAGDAHLARQCVARAVAAGTRALVLTDRPGEWRHLEAEVADAAVLRVEAAGARGLAAARGDGAAGAAGRFGALVIDCTAAGTGPPPVPGDTTVMRIVPAATADAVDARVRQDHASPDTVHVVIHGHRATASVVTIPDEARLIGRPAA